MGPVISSQKLISTVNVPVSHGDGLLHDNCSTPLVDLGSSRSGGDSVSFVGVELTVYLRHSSTLSDDSCYERLGVNDCYKKRVRILINSSLCAQRLLLKLYIKNTYSFACKTLGSRDVKRCVDCGVVLLSYIVLHTDPVVSSVTGGLSCCAELSNFPKIMGLYVVISI